MFPCRPEGREKNRNFFSLSPLALRLYFYHDFLVILVETSPRTEVNMMTMENASDWFVVENFKTAFIAHFVVVDHVNPLKPVVCH